VIDDVMIPGVFGALYGGMIECLIKEQKSMCGNSRIFTTIIEGMNCIPHPRDL